MPVSIVRMQRQLRELGRIRTGTSTPGADGKRRAKRLHTFRLTSPTRSLIDAAAATFGGIVQPWERQWQVITGVDALDIIVPPGQPSSTWFELWAGGGLLRRCDGETMTDGAPCACPADNAERIRLAKEGEACKVTTRLNVMLPTLPDLGVWRLESHGYYAAVELAGAVDVLTAAAASGRLIPARLRLEQRSKSTPGQPRHDYTVPIIEFVDVKLADLDIVNLVRPQLAAGERRIPALPPGPLPETSDLRGPDEPEASIEELDDVLRATGTSVGEARLLADQAYGPGPLTGRQRYDLIERLRARIEPSRLLSGDARRTPDRPSVK